jgi:hypothetical protein
MAGLTRNTGKNACGTNRLLTRAALFAACRAGLQRTTGGGESREGCFVKLRRPFPYTHSLAYLLDRLAESGGQSFQTAQATVLWAESIVIGKS